MMDFEQPTNESSSGITRIDRGTGTLTTEASRLFRVYKTMSAMLAKRGYMVSREMKEMTPMDFTNRFGEYPSREGLTILVVSEMILPPYRHVDNIVVIPITKDNVRPRDIFYAFSQMNSLPSSNNEL
jgi:hypothetical protein